MKKMLPRDVQARIVADLSRGYRTLQAIAERHQVTVQVVRQLRDLYGPDLPKLIDAAAQLRKPGPALPVTHDGVVAPTPPAPEPVPEPEPATPPQAAPEPEPEVVPEPVGPPATPAELTELVQDVTTRTVYHDGLSRDDRHACRAWWASVDPEASVRGMIPQRVVDGWDTAGRPTVAPPEIKTMQNNGAGASPVVEVVPDIEHAVDITWQPTVPDAADDDVIDVEIVDADPHEEACHLLTGLLIDVDQLRDTIRRHPDLADAVEDANYFLGKLIRDADEKKTTDDLVDTATQALVDLAAAGQLGNTHDQLRAAAVELLRVLKVA